MVRGWITCQSVGNENPITVDMWDLFSHQHKIAINLVKPLVVKWNRIVVEGKVLEDVVEQAFEEREEIGITRAMELN